MISKFFISRPKFAFVIAILILIAGGVAIKCLPVAQYPSIVPPQVSVTATYPGASAETVAATVTTPLEQQINGVENMIYMSSVSTDNGTCSITISFEVGSDPNMNTVNVNNRVSNAMSTLPTEVVNQGITVQQQSGNMLLIAVVHSESGKFDDTFLSNFTTINLLYPVGRIPGVGQASVLGGQNYAMRIWLDPTKMATLKVSAADVIAAIKSQNMQVSSGQVGAPPGLNDTQFQYTVLTQGRLSEVSEFENIIIKSTPNGAYVKIKDIATVELGANGYSSYGLLNNKPAALLAIYQLPDANALQTGQAVKEEIANLSKKFPADIKVDILYDTTKFVVASIDEVVTTLFIAVILVILVTFLFLQDWRSAMIPTIAIPVSLVGTFAILLLLGYSINLITLFGLILAIGIVVDDAIVVTENVHRIMEEDGLDSKPATLKSMEQVTSPIIATTAVLLATFIPVAFLPGITGQLYRQFAVTIVVAVCLSALNALTLSPALCSIFLSNKPHKEFIFFKYFNKIFNYITDKYNKTVSFLIRRLIAVGICFVIILCLIGFMYGKIPSGFIPSEDQGAFFVNVQLPNGSSLNRTDDVMRQVTDILTSTPGVANVLSVPGYSILSQSTSSNYGFAIANLNPWDERTSPATQINALINRTNMALSKIPGAIAFAFNLPPIQGLGTANGFQFEMQQTVGSSSTGLASVMERFLSIASKSPVLSGLNTTYRANVPKVYLDIDREKARKMGVDLGTLFTTIESYWGTYYVNQFNKYGQVYQVLLQSQEEFRNQVKDLNALYVLNKDGNKVPLSTFITTKATFGPNVVNHYNLLNSLEIIGESAPGYSSGQAIAEMDRIADDVFPDNMTYSWSGTAYQEIIAGNMVVIIFILAITFIYLFLVAQYESWLIAFAVILSVPVAFFGALIAIMIAGIDNNIYVQIGFALLFGMAAKTAILIVEFAKEQRAAGKPILDAAEIAAKLRFRAIIMTSFAFILGVLPLVISTGPSSASRRSLGTAVFGGMIMAAILGTIIIPAFYVTIQKIIEYKWKKK